eukprot:364220-Chlamydomonas_euryale.AAC.6
MPNQAGIHACMSMQAGEHACIHASMHTCTHHACTDVQTFGMRASCHACMDACMDVCMAWHGLAHCSAHAASRHPHMWRILIGCIKLCLRAKHCGRKACTATGLDSWTRAVRRVRGVTEQARRPTHAAWASADTALCCRPMGSPWAGPERQVVAERRLARIAAACAQPGAPSARRADLRLGFAQRRALRGAGDRQPPARADLVLVRWKEEDEKRLLIRGAVR